jgi:hypothetical protein
MITTTTSRKLAAPHLVPASCIIERISELGSHFFDPPTMRFFRSRTAKHGWFFNDDTGFQAVLVTSEEYVHEGVSHGRYYTVRHWKLDGSDLQTHHHPFQEHATSREAESAAARLVASIVHPV